MSVSNKDQQVINALKGLVIDAVNAAQSGHPGGAMGSMDFAYILFTEYMKFDPTDPKWPGRDRFVLSAGHMSMQLYSLLYARDWLKMDDLRKFRQLHSRTPGHPENFMTPGVECTTGPLGQGAAMSVGMAIGAKHLQAALDSQLYDYRTFALLGDGCMQEDVTLGAASLAGHLKLSNLIWFYDRNRKQISGDIARATSDDENLIFTGFGWNVLEIDGHDFTQIRQTLDKVTKTPQNKPTLIIGKTVMAKGAYSMEEEHETHGAPLPAEERTQTKAKLGIPAGQDFYFTDDLKAHFQRNFAKNKDQVVTWQNHLKKLLTDKTFKQKYETFTTPITDKNMPAISWKTDKALATRNAFGEIIAKWCETMPQLIGGSADLEPSNMTGDFAKKVGDFQADNYAARNIAFGVREFPMAAICNGLALNEMHIPFSATFLSFADYSRPALRLGAIQRIRVIHEFTHDSFYLGEDGPTHQPIEHIMSLRAMPDFYVMRPGDSYETEVMMREAMKLKQPSAICLTRQKLAFLPVPDAEKANIGKGAYVLKAADKPDLVMFATGSEVNLALAAAAKLEKDGRKVQVVSMPCWELFFKQDKAYQTKVLTPDCQNRVSVEAGATLGWERIVGNNGLMIGIDHYGASAPAGDLEKEYGFTPDSVCEKIQKHFDL